MDHSLIVLLLLIGSQINSFAQEARGSLGFGYFRACPQNGLKDINYDDGHGMSISYMSRKWPVGSWAHFQYGGRMDFASMDKREYDPVLLNTPTEDYGDVKVSNSMYGTFALARFSFGNGRVQPYAEALIGHRTFNTQQQIQAQNPDFNPQFESLTVYDKVVYTNRFHYGGSLGVTYQLNKYIILEAGVTYTEGGEGAVMPLDDIYQEGPVLRYPHVFSETDMLLINGGIRFQFYKIQRRPSSGSSPSSTPKKYTDPPQEDNPPPPPPPPPIEKRKLEPKKDTKPKKNNTERS